MGMFVFSFFMFCANNLIAPSSTSLLNQPHISTKSIQSLASLSAAKTCWMHWNDFPEKRAPNVLVNKSE